MSKETIFLGAGFSRHLCDEMPLLNELSEKFKKAYPQKISQLELDAHEFDFESLITYLATSYPWKSPQEAHSHRSFYFEAIKFLVKILQSTELDYFTKHKEFSNLSSGDQKLLLHWFSKEASIITLNYDTILDTWLLELTKVDPPPLGKKTDLLTHLDLYKIPILDLMYRTGGSLMGGGRIATWGLQLVKLHGSANWMHSGDDDSSGDSAYYINRYFENLSKLRHNLRGLRPLIIPPSFEKNAAIGSSSLQKAIWQSARDLLSGAQKVIFIGYSFPPSDVYIKLLIASALKDPFEVVLVNRDKSQEYLDRVENFFSAFPQCTAPKTVLTVEEYIQSL